MNINDDWYYVGPKYPCTKYPLEHYPLSTVGTWKFHGARESWILTGSLHDCILTVTGDYGVFSDIIYHRSMSIEVVEVTYIDYSKKAILNTRRTLLKKKLRASDLLSQEIQELQELLKQGI